MKIEKKENNRGRLILTGMIVNNTVCGQVASVWDKEGMFSSPWENTIGGWCVRYYKRHGRAPRKDIQPIYEEWADSGRKDKDTIKLVERLLDGLSGQFVKTSKEMNPQFVIDLAAKHFEEVGIAKYAQDLTSEIEAGKVEDARKRISKFRAPQIGSGATFDILHDREGFKEAFEEKRESLVQYPGDAGKFFGEELEREAFIAFIAPPKRGKTWWLLDMAWRAVLQRKKVAFFQVGDLTKRQMYRRFGIRAARLPSKTSELSIPKSITIEDSKPLVEFHDSKKYTGLSWQEAWEAVEKTSKDKIRSNDSYLKISVHPTKSISVAGVNGILDQLQYQNWVPDLVLIDYADILAGPPGFHGESRDAVNETWMGLRRMSQERHCMVGTVTQGNAASFDAELMTMAHFSEDNRKLAHVTGMIGINQTAEEKKIGVQSLNWLVLREDEFHIKRRLYVAGCLGVANPCVKSVMAF